MNLKKSTSSVTWYLLIATVLMYVQPIPLGTETVPILLLLGCVILYLTGSLRGGLEIDREHQLLMLFVFALAGYSLVAFVTHPERWLTVAKYWIGPFVFFALVVGKPELVPRRLHVLVLLLLVLTLAVVSGLSLAVDVLKGLLPRVSLQFTTRGVSVLTPEPSYLAHFGMLFYVLAEHGWRRSLFTRKARELTVVVTSVLLVISSSAFSYLVLAGYWAWRVWVFRRSLLFLAGGLLLLFLVTADSLPPNRVGQVLSSVKTASNSTTSFVEFLASVDPSGSTRLFLNAAGIGAGFVHPLGAGIGSYGDVFMESGEAIGLPMKAHRIVSLMIPETTQAQTYYANIAAELGLFSLLFLFAMVGYAIKARSSQKLLVLYFLLLCLLFQAQISNPTPWILAYLMTRRFNETYPRN